MNKVEYNKRVRSVFKEYRKLKSEGIAEHGDKYFAKQNELNEKIKGLFYVKGGLEYLNESNLWRFIEMESSWRFIEPHSFLLRLSLVHESKSQ